MLQGSSGSRRGQGRLWRRTTSLVEQGMREREHKSRTVERGLGRTQALQQGSSSSGAAAAGRQQRQQRQERQHISSTATLAGTFIASMVKYTPLMFNNTYEYPWWAYIIGGCLILSSTLMVPLWMGYSISITPGTLRKKVQFLCTPAPDLFLPRTQKGALCPTTFESFTEMCTLRPDRTPDSPSATVAHCSTPSTPTNHLHWV
ncbi:hypothetical protein SKAU_G00095420 [Synaphobranchus kaupii]|uniref:Uncharacterized protein n=1 Tax=Synaphobranchus kaupii TaxID=118154 RepID=A0A9Q1J6L4_SYNKA|nr:hypothetical protein SKAU_G00095420 [Synaphobranchus kaupii]